MERLAMVSPTCSLSVVSDMSGSASILSRLTRMLMSSDRQLGFFAQLCALAEHLREDQYDEDQEQVHQVDRIVESVRKAHPRRGGKEAGQAVHEDERHHPGGLDHDQRDPDRPQMRGILAREGIVGD